MNASLLTLILCLLLALPSGAQNSRNSSNSLDLGTIREQLRMPDSALNSLRKISFNQLADSLKSEFYRLKGSAYFYKGITDSAIIYFSSAKAMHHGKPCSDQFALVSNGLAVVLQSAELFEEAIDNYTVALSCADEQHDELLKLRILSNLSILNREVGSIDQAWFFLNRAFELSKKLNETSGLASLYNSKGQIYLRTEQFDSARIAFNQSLALRDEEDLKGRAICLNNLGYISSSLDQHDEALEYYALSSELRQQIGDLAGNASLFVNMANIYLEKGDLVQASQYLQNAKILNQRVKSSSIEGRITMSSALLEEKRGNLSESLHLLKNYVNARDSLDDFINLEKIASTPYTVALMEAENKMKLIQEEEAKQQELLGRQRIINLTLAIGLAIFIGLISLFIYQVKMLSNLRKTLMEERDAAKRSAESRRETLNAVVHELKTPMNAIISLTDLMLKEEDPKEIKKMTELLHRSSYRLRSTTNNVLTYSRVERGSVQLVRRVENVGEIVQELCALLEVQAKAKNLEFSCILDDSPIIKIDRSIFEIIIMNLVGNAIKYTDVGGVEVNLKANEYYSFISIKDTGLGISKEDMDQIFEPFFQSENTPRVGREGAGLGLSICRYYAELIGAEIKVESQLGEGSEFLIILKKQ